MVCARYTDEVVDNDHTWEQGQRLEASQEWREMMDRVRQSLGIGQAGPNKPYTRVFLIKKGKCKKVFSCNKT